MEKQDLIKIRAALVEYLSESEEHHYGLCSWLKERTGIKATGIGINPIYDLGGACMEANGYMGSYLPGASGRTPRREAFAVKLLQYVSLMIESAEAPRARL
jgi:hypothetical protein